MASGYGAFGGVGRCYKFWVKLKECMADPPDIKLCKPIGEDYIECLHHRKEFTRLNQIEEQRRHLEANGEDVGKGPPH
eukprot:CAMPEP_0185697366 /NCGR_PEP_ID=MMETSP1164-20130828/5701_1 /TAXON_ID=1104430 /ORGANISM="Chrysoreinhardia sp, Strain CCMP2950" /LENGTH=77 /DNA_ID=CAMNT_0028364263 /DNA_START=100 /DNA_END=333 /DNA_ORIENTATION=-